MSASLPYIDERLREFILDMVGQEDDVGLIHSLVRSLYGVTSFPDIHFYQAKRDKQLHDGPDAPGWIVLDPMSPNQPPRPLRSIAGLEEGLETREIVYLENPERNELVVIHPIVHGELVSFVTMQCQGYAAAARAMVEFFLVLYARQAGMVHKKERDVLTGLLNRQSFDERITKVLLAVDNLHKRSRDHNHGACIGILDIDHFKRVNDTYGHMIGDEVLVLFARLMDQTFRHSDFLFRFGGEEFLVVLTDVAKAQAMAALDRFRQTVESFAFPQVGRVTVSIGGVVIEAGDLPPTLYDRADKALYYAKHNGRNQLHFYQDLVASGALQEEEVDAGEIELWG